MNNMVFENKNLRLVLNEDGTAESLVSKLTGEELLSPALKLPFFAATQDRPYNNEIKLAYMNKKTRFEASSVRMDGEGRLLVKFGLYPFEAVIKPDIKDEYITFTLVDFIADQKDYPPPMDFPPVTELTLIQLPFEKSLRFGSWLNVVHTGSSSAAVMATSPHPYIDSNEMGSIRILSATARSGILLKGCTCALVVAPTENFLDAVDSLEHDFGLPLGVESRRSAHVNSSIMWVSTVNPSNVDEYISIAKAGGFKYMLIYYPAMLDETDDYTHCGDYVINSNYPNGIDDLKLVLGKLKEAGITPGMHFLHTHVGAESQYVTPVADRRLNLKRRFTLSKPLTKDDTVIFVDQNPIDSPKDFPKCRLLRFDGEIISYEGYTTEPPYMFTGCKRGHFDTYITEHAAYTVGGVLDVSEFGGTSIYLDQDSDLQDEIGDKLAKVYNAGMEFIYFDGSEGTNAPFDYHVPNAQYRMYKKMKNAPLFCEGAAKAHFGWHMLSGANAFDIFQADVYKEMIIEHPFTEAKLMKNDFTRVNFGWWGLIKNLSVDLWEYGTSKAYALDCPATAMLDIENIKKVPRIGDILEMLRRWELVREKKLLTDDEKRSLGDPNREFTLLINKNGELELAEYRELKLPATLERLRVFTLTRGKHSVAVIWDMLGECRISLSDMNVLSYTKEIETGAIPYAVSNKTVILPVSGKAYITSDLSEEALREKLLSAALAD